jgi:hypothetical protein
MVEVIRNALVACVSCWISLYGETEWRWVTLIVKFWRGCVLWGCKAEGPSRAGKLIFRKAFDLRFCIYKVLYESGSIQSWMELALCFLLPWKPCAHFLGYNDHGSLVRRPCIFRLGERPSR